MQFVAMVQNTKHHVEYYNEHCFYILMSFLTIIPTYVEAKKRANK